MIKKFIIPFVFASSFSCASEESDYQKAVGELFRGESKIVYRVSEFSPGMRRIFDKYVDKMDPPKDGVVEFGQPFSSGDIYTGEPTLRLVFAFSSKKVGAILIQHGGGFGVYTNIVVFDTEEDWYCYSDLVRDISFLSIRNIEIVLQDKMRQRKLPTCEKW